MSSLVLMFLAVGDVQLPTQGKYDLRAEDWIVKPSIRIHDDRPIVLLFFTSIRAARLQPLLENMALLASRNDVVVMALTPESTERARRVVTKHDTRFAVGTGSRSHKQFGIRKFPVLVVVPSNGPPILVDAEDADQVASLFRRLGYDDVGIHAELTPVGLSTARSTEDLRRQAEIHPDIRARMASLDSLREQLTTADFTELCDELLASDDPDMPRGEIAYRRHLADPSTVEKETLLAPSSAAMREFRENPEDQRWNEVREFRSRMASTPNADLSDQLWTEYYAHWSDSPSDLLVRREVAQRIEELNQAEVARGMLMELLPQEPDATIRMIMAGGIWELSPVGDLETANFLERQLARETNIRSVRSTLETAIRCLRTGEGPCE